MRYLSHCVRQDSMPVHKLEACQHAVAFWRRVFASSCCHCWSSQGHSFRPGCSLQVCSKPMSFASWACHLNMLRPICLQCPHRAVSVLAAHRNLLPCRTHLGSFGVSGALALQPMYTLSGGQKRRVAFAKVTFSKPHILLLDEPR